MRKLTKHLKSEGKSIGLMSLKGDNNNGYYYYYIDYDTFDNICNKKDYPTKLLWDYVMSLKKYHNSNLFKYIKSINNNSLIIQRIDKINRLKENLKNN